MEKGGNILYLRRASSSKQGPVGKGRGKKKEGG